MLRCMTSRFPWSHHILARGMNGLRYVYFRNHEIEGAANHARNATNTLCAVFEVDVPVVVMLNSNHSKRYGVIPTAERWRIE